MKKLFFAGLLSLSLTFSFFSVASAIPTFEVSGTFESIAQSPGPFVDQILGGSFSGTYSLSGTETYYTFPAMDTFEMNFYDATSSFVASLSSDAVGHVGWIRNDSPLYDTLLFYDDLGFAPYLQLFFDKSANGIGPISDTHTPSAAAWYNGSTGEVREFIHVAEAQNVPVPEPSTFLLLGGGLAGLAFYARRRRKE